MSDVSTQSNVKLERDGDITVVRMNRPERRNALSLEMMRELTGVFRTLGADRTVRAVILCGEGPAFSAGHDLREVSCADLDAQREIFGACVELMQTIQMIPQPVIAEVAAIATAAGCQLVATCDLAVASSEARFATPGVRIGLFCTTPMVALTRAIGSKRAMEMLLTGDPIDARTALDWGLVNRVVEPNRLHDTSLELARKIAEAARVVVAIGKEAFYHQVQLNQSDAYAYACEVMSKNAVIVDAREGMTAFFARRAPHWQP